MGCKYACTCSGNCLTCGMYEPEEYCGHAEDIMAQANGFRDSDDMDKFYQRQEEYPEQLDTRECPKQK